MSLKRKWEKVGEHIVSAAVGDMVSRAIATVVDKVERRAEADGGEVDRLDRLVTMVRSAADAAEGVHIRSWWLRRWQWHWQLRDAACEGAAAVRSNRRRREAEKQELEGKGTHAHACAAGGRPRWRWGGSVVRLLIRSAANVLFRGGSPSPAAAALRSEVARMEETAAGLGEFLKLLDIEIRRQEGSGDIRLSLMDVDAEEEERDAHQIRQPSQFSRRTVRVRRIARLALRQGGGEEGDEIREDIEQDFCCRRSRAQLVAAVINEEEAANPRHSEIRLGLWGHSTRARPVASVQNEDVEVANLTGSKPYFGHRSGGQLVAAVLNEDDEAANQSRSQNMEERIWVVMRLALGTRVIWFVLQAGSRLFRRGRLARPSPR